MLESLSPSDWTIYHAAHLLNRAGFGGTPEEIRKLYSLGLEDAVDSLLVGNEVRRNFRRRSGRMRRIILIEICTSGLRTGNR